MVTCFLLGCVLLVCVLAPTMAAALAVVVCRVCMRHRLGELCLLAGRYLAGGVVCPSFGRCCCGVPVVMQRL